MRVPVLLLALVTNAADDPKAVREGPVARPAADAGVGRLTPDLAGTDLAGTAVKLSAVGKNRKAVVVALTSTSCPISKKYLPTFAALERKYAAKGVAFVYVNPVATDKPDAARAAVKAAGVAGAYLPDADGALAKALGATSTADVFVLDAKRTVVYHGAADDQYGLGYSLEKPTRTFAADALDAVLAGDPVKLPATTAPGCELDLAGVKAPPAAAVTFHNRISRIVQTNCGECHRDGGVGPFPLTTLEDVVARKGMIRKVVEKGSMPPWFAAPPGPAHPRFANDRSLPAADKTDLLAWLAAGTPEGDAADAPLPRPVPGEWVIGQPDAIFQIPKPIAIKATGTMPYQNVMIDSHLTEDKWVQAYEIRPTDKSVVHHVLAFIQTPGDAATGGRPEDSEGRDGYFAVYVPGNSSQVFPDGFAKKLPKGSRMRLQIHYTPNGTATIEQVRVGVRYAAAPPKYELKVAGVANPKIKIPPGAADHPEKATIKTPVDVVVTAFLPHLHYRGKSCRYEATPADGGKPVPLLDIPRYDFHWQYRYELATPVPLARGSAVTFHAVFDNSDKNPANPDPKKTVKWGPQTTDEMHLGYVEFYIPAAKD